MMMTRVNCLFLILGMISVISCREKTPGRLAAPVTGVRVEEVSEESISIPVHSTGILYPAEDMKLSFKTGGIVQQVKVKEGEKVRKGDILAELNLSEINAQVDQARSGYEKALRDYNRASNLFADSVATLEQKQNASTVLSMARSNYEIAKFNQLHSRITAPSDGVILKQFIKTNELAAPGYPVFLFGTSDRYWKVKAGLSDREIVKINTGDSAIVMMDAWPGIKFTAVVEQTGGISNPVTGTYLAELILEDMGYRMAAGFVVSADIFPSGKETYLLVPVESLVDADGQSGYLFTVDDSSVVKKLKVSIVTITGTKAAIKTGDFKILRVVTGGAAYLRDGEKVKIIE